MQYYAVVCGRKPGIYTSHKDFDRQVRDYKHAIWKKTTSLAQAEAFLQELSSEEAKQNYWKELIKESIVRNQEAADLPILQPEPEVPTLYLYGNPENHSYDKTEYPCQLFVGGYANLSTCVYSLKIRFQKKQAMKTGHVKKTKNIAMYGEMQAILEGLAIAKKYKQNKILIYYKDSNIIGYLSGLIPCREKDFITKAFIEHMEYFNKSLSILFIQDDTIGKEMKQLAKDSLGKKGA